MSSPPLVCASAKRSNSSSLTVLDRLGTYPA